MGRKDERKECTIKEYREGLACMSVCRALAEAGRKRKETTVRPLVRKGRMMSEGNAKSWH